MHQDDEIKALKRELASTQVRNDADRQARVLARLKNLGSNDAVVEKRSPGRPKKSGA